MCKMKNTQDASSTFKYVHLARLHKQYKSSTVEYKNMFCVGIDNIVGSVLTFSADVLRASRVQIPAPHHFLSALICPIIIKGRNAKNKS